MTDHTASQPAGAPRRKPYRRVAAVPEVQSVTNAALAHSDEMHSRMVKYATAMGIRMACIALIFVFDGWYKLIPVVGAVILPWIAVVIANGGADTNHMSTTALLDAAPPYELPDASPFTNDDDAGVSSVILTGDFLLEDDAGDSDTDAPPPMRKPDTAMQEPNNSGDSQA